MVSWHGGGGGDGGGDGDAGGGDSATHWPQVSAQLVRIHGYLHLCACKRSFSPHQVLPLLSWHGGDGGGDEEREGGGGDSEGGGGEGGAGGGKQNIQ